MLCKFLEISKGRGMPSQAEKGCTDFEADAKSVPLTLASSTKGLVDQSDECDADTPPIEQQVKSVRENIFQMER